MPVESDRVHERGVCAAISSGDGAPQVGLGAGPRRGRHWSLLHGVNMDQTQSHSLSVSCGRTPIPLELGSREHPGHAGWTKSTPRGGAADRLPPRAPPGITTRPRSIPAQGDRTPSTIFNLQSSIFNSRPLKCASPSSGAEGSAATSADGWRRREPTSRFSRAARTWRPCASGGCGSSAPLATSTSRRCRPATIRPRSVRSMSSSLP